MQKIVTSAIGSPNVTPNRVALSASVEPRRGAPGINCENEREKMS